MMEISYESALHWKHTVQPSYDNGCDNRLTFYLPPWALVVTYCIRSSHQGHTCPKLSFSKIISQEVNQH